MNESNRYGGAHLLLAFLAGAVAGGTVALLTAPQSGRETRARVRGWAHDLGEVAPRVPGAMREAFAHAAEAARTAFAEALREKSVEPEARG